MSEPNDSVIKNRWLIIITVMSATLMQALDTTIVNVALPHMQGALSASSDQISWTLTSYLVASGIFMPLTGYFADRLGQKNYLQISIIGFTVASALCGASETLVQMIFFRLLQGAFGAALVPLSQAILSEVHSRKEQGKAMAIWGAGVMVGPILGPTLGGYLTDIANWRWTFYVNVPVGIITCLLAWQVMPTTVKKNRNMDWLGLVLISCAIGAVQFVLDRGNQVDWWNAHSIQIGMLIATIGFFGFLYHSLRPSNRAVFDLRIFKDRNFTISSLLLAAFGLGLNGTMAIQPLFLENLLNYPVITTGMNMAPRGITSMLSMIIVSKLINRYDPRILMCFGICLCVLGISVGTFYSQNINSWFIVWPLLVQGMGFGMVFVPLSTVAFSTLSDNMRIEAAGLFSLLRTIGSSIGISITETVLSRHSQIAWNQLGGFIQPYNPALTQYLHTLHMKITDPAAAPILANVLEQQAQMIGFIDVYEFIMWSFLLMLPLVFLLKRNSTTTLSQSVIGH